MLSRPHLHQSLTVLAVSSALALSIGSENHAIAHQVKTSADIGGTVHIEPNDTPKAGEPAVAWFALTQRGGAPVPLSDCQCQLAVYSGAQEGAIATPSLVPLSIEGYDNIPSATVTFPAVGQYELVITGRPATEGAFQPFELRFPVTVATVAPAAAQSAPSDEPSPSEATALAGTADPPNSSPFPGVAIALVPALLVAVGWGLFSLRRAKPSAKDDDQNR